MNKNSIISFLFTTLLLKRKLFFLFFSFVTFTCNIENSVLFSNYKKIVYANYYYSFANELMPYSNVEVLKTYQEIFNSINQNCPENDKLREDAKEMLPIIERILYKNKIPDDFKYLAMVESKLNPSILAKDGSRGMWQLQSVTARNFGLHITNKIDERDDICKSTEAICALLNEHHKKFGSWTLAALAYNIGTGSVSEGIKKGIFNHEYLYNSNYSAFLYKIIAYKKFCSNINKKTVLI